MPETATCSGSPSFTAGRSCRANCLLIESMELGPYRSRRPRTRSTVHFLRFADPGEAACPPMS